MEKTTFSTVRSVWTAVIVLAIFLLGGSGLFRPGMAEAVGPSADNPGLQRAMEVQGRHSERMMAIPGVVGHGVGVSPSGAPVIKVFLERAGIPGVPDFLEGVRVRTKVTGRIIAYVDPTSRFPRPVPIGVSSGHPEITAGTIGSRVTGDLDGNGIPEVYALSNNHVYANQNDAQAGDSVLQPGPYDGGTDPADKIGSLHAFVPIYFDGRDNLMDAAIALSSISELGYATPGTAGTDGYGAPSPAITDASPGQFVQKYGRTTGWTHGVVDTINTVVDVCYQSQGPFRCKKLARFVGQIAITPGTFSDGGDSGSLIVTEDGRNPVGLLFAGGGDYTFANPIGPVLQTFNVAIDSGAPTTPFTDIAIAGVDAAGPVVQGATVGVNVTVRNEGNQNVGSFDVDLNDTTDNYFIGSLTVSGLASGDSTQLTFPWNTSGASVGSHTLAATHDLADDDATNDSGTGSVLVEAATTDVAVTAVSAPASVVKGDTVGVSVTVQNIGNQDVSGFNVMLEDSTDNAYLGSEAVSALSAGASRTVTFSWDTTGSSVGEHSLAGSHDLADDEAGNDSRTTEVLVNEPGAIVLTATGYKVKGRHSTDLAWTGATSASVDVWRDGSLVTTTANDGAYTDATGNVGGGSYIYKVCESGTAICSNEATSTF